MTKSATYTSTHTFHSLTRKYLLVLRDLSDVEISKGWCIKNDDTERKFLPFLHDYLEEIEMKASFSQNHLKQVKKIDFLQFKSIETCLKFLIS